MEEEKSRMSVARESRVIIRPSVGYSNRQSMVGSARSRNSCSSVYRKSYGFGSISAIRPEHHLSMIDYRRPTKQFLNTYQLDPRRPFHVARAQMLIDGVLDDMFYKHIYNRQVR